MLTHLAPQPQHQVLVGMVEQSPPVTCFLETGGTQTPLEHYDSQSLRIRIQSHYQVFIIDASDEHQFHSHQKPTYSKSYSHQKQTEPPVHISW